MDKTVQPGQLVSSKAGRDKDKYYLVVEIINDSFVYVADGVTREIKSPKKKNLKHLTVHQAVVPDFARKISGGQIAGNAAVHGVLEALIGELRQVPAHYEEVD